MDIISNQNCNYSSVMNRGSGGAFRESFLITYIPSVSPTFSILPGQWLQANNKQNPTEIYTKKKIIGKRNTKRLTLFWSVGTWMIFVCFSLSAVSIFSVQAHITFKHFNKYFWLERKE